MGRRFVPYESPGDWMSGKLSLRGTDLARCSRPEHWAASGLPDRSHRLRNQPSTANGAVHDDEMGVPTEPNVLLVSAWPTPPEAGVA